MLSFTDTRPSSSDRKSERPTLVMSHSFGFSKREWIEVAGLLADEYRTVAIDMPGFGASNDVSGFTMAEISAQFAEVILELELKRYVLVGHSMTGKIMSILASKAGKGFGLEHPPEKLVLLTSTPLSREVASDEMRQGLLETEKNRWEAHKFVETHVGLPLSPDTHERAMQDYLQVSRAAWEAWIKEGVLEDWVERAAPITLPTLVIAAVQDEVWGLEMQKELTMPHLTNARIMTINCGHSVPMEQPQQLAQILRDFVEE